MSKHPVSFGPEGLDRPDASDRTGQSGEKENGVNDGENVMNTAENVYHNPQINHKGQPGCLQNHIENEADPEKEHKQKRNRNDQLGQTHGHRLPL
jgi:hypothetical protein